MKVSAMELTRACKQDFDWVELWAVWKANVMVVR